MYPGTDLPANRVRTRGAASLVVILAIGVVGACEDGRPVARPYPGDRAPIVTDSGVLESPTPAESLLVYDGTASGPAARPLELLFHRGRGVARDGSGAAYVPDLAGSRVLVVEPGLRVRRTVGGPDPAQGPLGLPLSAAATSDGAVFLADVEHPDGLLYYDADGAYVGSATPPVLNPLLRAGPDGALWAARSPYIRGFDPAGPGDPLLYRFDPLTGEGVGIAAVEPVVAAEWSRLANAGPLAVGPDGVAYFAFLLRNELRAYRADGTLVWRARRSLPLEASPSGIDAAPDELVRVRPVTQALAVGPDGRLYALTASLPPSKTGALRRLEVYDPRTGALLRATTVPEAWTSFAADAEGRVFRVDADAIDATAPAPERAPLPDVPLVAFEGDTLRFADYRGRALLVNFWASWCVPCREELPKLAEHYESLSEADRPYVEFLAISDDDDPAAARRFAEPFDLPFPLFLGAGEMRTRFGYVALPYTLIVDYRGRIVDELYGFGSPESWDRLVTTLDREIGLAKPSSSAGQDPVADPHEAHGSHDPHEAHDPDQPH